jgi:thioredoxin 1
VTFITETGIFQSDICAVIWDMETKNKGSFKEIIQGDQLVLVDFSAEWCGPCKMMAPILKELAGKVGSGVRILKVDVDRNPAVAGSYQVQGVPTLILFRNGKVLWRQSGVQSASALESIINTYR